MIKPTFKTPDFSKIIGELEKLSQQKQKEIAEAVESSAQDIVLEAKQRAPVGVDGALQNQISYKPITPFQYEIVANTKYSAFMEFGTRTLVEMPPGTEEIAADVQKAYQNAKRAGKTGTIEQMEANIRRWVRLKGISATYSVKTRRRSKRNAAEEARENSAVFLIMRKLLNVGVRPQPFFYPTIARQSKILENKLNKVVNNVDNK